jgi:hypothetical protein
VERLEDRHRRHRGAVRVGDDAFRRFADEMTIDLADDIRLPTSEHQHGQKNQDYSPFGY